MPGGGRHRALISFRDCERCFRTDPLPNDAEPYYKLAREFGIDEETALRWLCWDPHPCLGRKIAGGIGECAIEVNDPNLPPSTKPATGREKSPHSRTWRGPFASRADMKLCAEFFKEPLHKKFPGNPGVWVGEGIFQRDGVNGNDGRLFFTDEYVESNRATFGLPPRVLSLSCYRDKLETIKVIWPGSASPERWTLRVHSQASLEKLAAWRQGKVDDGEWLNETLWQDTELWYHSSVLVKHLLRHGVAKGRGNAYKKLQDLNLAGLLNRAKEPERPGRKCVPSPVRTGVAKSGKKKGGPPCFVYCQEVTTRLLGLSREQLLRLFETLVWPAPAPTEQTKPAAPSANAPKMDEPLAPPNADEDEALNPSRTKQRWCYYQYMDHNKKLSRILDAATKLFGKKAPKNESDIYIYANRWAEHKKLPFSKRN